MINKRSIVGIVTVVFMVLFGAVPAFAAQQTTQTATVTVSDTIAIEALFNNVQNGDIVLGNLPADNGQTTVNGEVIRTRSNVAIDVATRLSGDFASGSNAITLNNLVFNNGTTEQFYTATGQTIFSNWAKAPKNPGYADLPVTFKITVPYGTDPGTYTTTVYFTASKHTGP